jgi:hypothetical protein
MLESRPDMICGGGERKRRARGKHGQHTTRNQALVGSRRTAVLSYAVNYYCTTCGPAGTGRIGLGILRDYMDVPRSGPDGCSKSGKVPACHGRPVPVTYPKDVTSHGRVFKACALPHLQFADVTCHGDGAMGLVP